MQVSGQNSQILKKSILYKDIMYQPLAEILRPTRIEDIIGQKHLVGNGMPIFQMANSVPQSMILWGPPGVGKTTIANILINKWQCESVKISAVFSGVKDIKYALEKAEQNRLNMFSKGPMVIFVDEIHRFNKAQQDAFLHHLEDGTIVLIGATTENPSFEINNALLSRLQVYVLKPISSEDLLDLVNLALDKFKTGIKITDDVKISIVDLADGDARKLLNIMEVIFNSRLNVIGLEQLKQIIPNSFRRFDKGGEQFYNQISALHKSVRGSDPDATLYWFSRMIDGGIDPLYLARRLLRMAWEDIGLADINAANIAINAIQTYERLGSPEGELALANCLIYLAVAPKSNSVELAYNNVREFVAKDISREVPPHLCNAPTKLMQDLGYAKEYKYAHNYPNHYVPNESYWPSDFVKQQFYVPTNQGLEAKIVERLRFLKDLDKKNM